MLLLALSLQLLLLHLLLLKLLLLELLHELWVLLHEFDVLLLLGVWSNRGVSSSLLFLEGAFGWCGVSALDICCVGSSLLFLGFSGWLVLLLLHEELLLVHGHFFRGHLGFFLVGVFVCLLGEDLELFELGLAFFVEFAVGLHLEELFLELGGLLWGDLRFSFLFLLWLLLLELHLLLVILLL